MNAKKIINIMNIQSYMFKIVLFASCLLSSPGLFAQCFDNSLNISTGAIENRDPTTFGAARRQDVAANGINDLHWRITNLSLALSTLYGTAIFNYPAMIVPCTLHTWGLNNEAAATAGCTINTTGKPNANWPESHWIAAIDATVQGFHWPQTTSAVNPYVTTYRRDFRICQDGDFDFNIVLAADNFCTAMRVDGIPVGNLLPQAGGHTPGNYTQFNDVNNPLVFKLALGAGLHNIEVDVENFHIAGSDNPHGLNLSGTIWETSNNPSLFNDFITDCEPCVVDEGPCSDLCYWTVTGNNINGINHNIFGTLNNNDIRIVTNNPSAIASQDRGIITKDGLFGWNLRTTNLPTAFLDVDCNGHNSQASGTSDIRFRSLETTNNTAFKSLVIDPATGYVYNSNVSPGGSSVAGWDLLGNSISGSNFLGTTNFDDLRIKQGTGKAF